MGNFYQNHPSLGSRVIFFKIKLLEKNNRYISKQQHISIVYIYTSILMTHLSTSFHVISNSGKQFLYYSFINLLFNSDYQNEKNYKSKKCLLEVKESVIMMRDKPSPNRNISSAPLYLFVPIYFKYHLNRQYSIVKS